MKKRIRAQTFSRLREDTPAAKYWVIGEYPCTRGNEINASYDSFRRQNSQRERKLHRYRCLSQKPSGITSIVLPSVLRPSSEIPISELKPLAARGGCVPMIGLALWNSYRVSHFQHRVFLLFHTETEEISLAAPCTILVDCVQED